MPFGLATRVKTRTIEARERNKRCETSTDADTKKKRIPTVSIDRDSVRNAQLVVPRILLSDRHTRIVDLARDADGTQTSSCSIVTIQ